MGGTAVATLVKSGALCGTEQGKFFWSMPRLRLLCLAGVGQPKGVGHHYFWDIIQFLSRLQL